MTKHTNLIFIASFVLVGLSISCSDEEVPNPIEQFVGDYQVERHWATYFERHDGGTDTLRGQTDFSLTVTLDENNSDQLILSGIIYTPITGVVDAENEHTFTLSYFGGIDGPNINGECRFVSDSVYLDYSSGSYSSASNLSSRSVYSGVGVRQ